MGKFWLNDVLSPLQESLGTKLKLYKGYETRSRSTGGFDGIYGIVIHHDADGPGGEDDWVLRYEYENAADRPIGNFHVQRDGDVWWGAAGASNHAGKGGAVTTSKGVVPLNSGNKFLIGIEASNNGIGEVWSDGILDSYIKLVTTLCRYYNLKPETDIYGHYDWCLPSCPGRKIDPAGPTPKYPTFGGTVGRATWKIDEFRKVIRANLTNTIPPPVQNWAELGKTFTTPPPTMNYSYVYSNTSWLQAVLCSMKSKAGNPYFNPAWVGVDQIGGKQQSNLYGDATRNAVNGFQIDFGLTSDGQYGTVTANKLYTVRGK